MRTYDPIYIGQRKKELEKLLKEITDKAKKVVEDYTKNPSEISGSIIQVHENSPLIDDKSDKK